MNGTWFVRSSEVLSRVVGSEVLLAAPGRADVAHLSETAGAVWRLLEAPQTVPSLARALAYAYGVSSETAAASIQPLLSELLKEGWVDCIADADD